MGRMNSKKRNGGLLCRFQKVLLVKSSAVIQALRSVNFCFVSFLFLF